MRMGVGTPRANLGRHRPPAQMHNIRKDLSLVTGITTSGDDSHRWEIRSLLFLRLGWVTDPGSCRRESAHGFGKQWGAFKSSEAKQATIDLLGVDQRVQPP